MKLVLLDNNILGELVHPANAVQLAQVQAAVAAGRFRAIISSALFEEVGAAHQSLALRMGEQLAKLSGGLFLRDVKDRIAREIKRGGRLAFEEAFLTFGADLPVYLERILAESGESAMRRKNLDEEWNLRLVSDFAVSIDIEVARLREDGGITKAQAHKRATELMFAKRHERAIALARSYLELEADAIGRAREWVVQCDPRAYPSLIRRWDFISTAQARYLMKARRGYDRGDLHDGAHFADAAYTDLMVSDDATFLRIAAETEMPTDIIRRSDPRWAELLGVERSEQN
jgi:hypothetical protein